MKTITCFVLLLSALQSFSQDSTVAEKKFNLKIIVPQTYNCDNMPNALAGKTYPQNYVGNNGKGFTIYESKLDGMRVIKPDNSFSSNMPTGNITSLNLFKKENKNLMLSDSTLHQKTFPELNLKMLKKQQQKMSNSLMFTSPSLQP
jgi:hypothetical protein